MKRGLNTMLPKEETGHKRKKKYISRDSISLENLGISRENLNCRDSFLCPQRIPRWSDVLEISAPRST